MTSSLFDQALAAARVDTFSRPACEQLLGLYSRAQGPERSRIGQLFESQFALADTEDGVWLNRRLGAIAMGSGRSDADDMAQEPEEDGGEIDWDNVAAETRIMLDLNRPAAQARKQRGEME